MMKKRWISSLLAFCLVLTLLPAGAFAAEPGRFPYQYETADGNTVVKISHPKVAPNARREDARYHDGVVDYVDGQLYAGTYETLGSNPDSGARGESYSWSAIGYGDDIYVGLLYNAMGQTIQQFPGIDPDYQVPEKMNELLDVLFNGDFFIPKDGGNPGGALVKINVKTGDVKILMSKATTSYSCGFRNAVLYKDKLYFCGNVGAAPQIWQVDPQTDACKFVYGMTVLEFYEGYRQGISTGIRGLCVYEDKLVISCVMKNPETGVIEPQIAISDDPDSGFTVIATQEQLFNYPAYHFTDSIYGGSIWEIVEFNHKLYVSICTGTPENMPDPYTMQSFAIVCGEEQADGSWTWRPVVGDKADGATYTFGIDPERTRAGAGVLMVYGDYLYIGEYNDEEIALIQLMFNLDPEFLNRNLTQSVSLYRMDKDENMELVVGDATEMFPDGSLSGIGSGFGRHENQYIWRMAVHNGKLYMGTFDTSSLLEPIGQFVNGDLVHMTPAQWKQLFTYIKALLDLSEEAEAFSAMLPVRPQDDRENIQWLLDRFDTDKLAELFGGLSGDCFAEDDSAVLEGLQDFDILNAAAALENVPSLDTLRKLAQAMQDMIELARKVIVTASYLSQAERGCDLYVTTDGERFTTLTTDGFGDPFNHGLRVFAQTESGLGFGTANPFYGTQWWFMEDEVPSVPDDPGTSGGSSGGSTGGSTGNPAPSDDPAADTETTAPDTFVDVAADAYYYDAVRWAAETGVTEGTGGDHFSPDTLCSRAQAVTFLWRAAGCPVVNDATNFSDIPADAYYAEAVRWAISVGITTGTSAALFSPDEPCTRGQLVTFLYRNAQARGAGLTGAWMFQNPFADVPDDSAYWEATMWALANGVTDGTSETTFSPNSTCTRGQIVTFLYRSEQS